MSDDRELVERLAAIGATPRASWVAELRADLDAAWETESADYLDSVRTTTLTLVDHEPTQPTSGRRWPILIGVAASAVVAVVLVASREADPVTPADEPTVTVTVPPTLPPRALNEGVAEVLVPGPYFVDDVDGKQTPRIVFTIGAGFWDKSYGDGEISMGDLSTIEFSRPGAVYSDACHSENGYHPGPVDTVDGLVAALREQRGWADVTAPADISVDGYAGRAFQRTAPADISDCDIVMGPSPTGLGMYPAFQSWQREDDATGRNEEAGLFYEPGQIETLWVLDIDGTVVVVNTRPRTEASAARRAELAAVLNSIRIDPA